MYILLIAIKLINFWIRFVLPRLHFDADLLLRAAAAAAHLFECLMKVKNHPKLMEFLKRVHGEEYMLVFAIAVFAIELFLSLALLIVR